MLRFMDRETDAMNYGGFADLQIRSEELFWCLLSFCEEVETGNFEGYDLENEDDLNK